MSNTLSNMREVYVHQNMMYLHSFEHIAEINKSSFACSDKEQTQQVYKFVILFILFLFFF